MKILLIPNELSALIDFNLHEFIDLILSFHILLQFDL